MAVCRLKARTKPPARTVLFAVFNGEELGLIGSCYYVKHPVRPIESTRAMLSLDMLGAANGSGLNLYGTTASANAWLADVMEGAAADAGLPWKVFRRDPWEASDHVCFEEAGVPAVMALTAGNHPNLHLKSDTAAAISLNDLRASGDLLWAALEVLADGREADYKSPSPVLVPAPRSSRLFASTRNAAPAD